MLRGLSATEYDRLVKAGQSADARGPHLPVIIEACGEGEKSYEYRHGAVSHGAFTYSLGSGLIARRARSPRGRWLTGRRSGIDRIGWRRAASL